MPGSRPERFEKALAAGADVVCVDLEDAVPPAGKAAARAAVIEALRAAPARFGVRVNGIRTAAGCADLAALAEAAVQPSFVMVPKVAGPADLEIAGAVLGRPTLPIVESAEGLRRAWEIAAAPGVLAVLFGGADLAADLGIASSAPPADWQSLWEPLLWARSALVAAAARAGVPLLDVPHLDVRDEAGLRASTRRARALGFHGRACIHPAQIAPVHEALAPAADDVAQAERVLAAFEAAGGGAALLDGRLVEAPVVRAARRTLAAARGNPEDR